MTPITKITPQTEADIELEALKDSAATQRALDYYLKPAVSQQFFEKKLFIVRSDLSQEEAMVNASDYLRCAIATANGAAESQQGSPRDLFLSVAHFAESAKMLLVKALDVQQVSVR